MEDKREVDIEQFYDDLWGNYISEDVVSDGYISVHSDFIWEITHSLYEVWRKDENLTMKVIARLAESFFICLFSYNPPQNIIFTKDLKEEWYY